jgi:hypothetical protein
MGEDRVVSSHRSTASGHVTCVTLVVRARTVDEVLEVYARVLGVTGLSMLL